MPDRNIFIVDDDEKLTRALDNIFTKSGYRVTIATNSKEAQKKLKTASFDLTILDMNMPGLGGPALLEIINKEYPGMKVVILTAHGKEYREKIEGLKFHAFLTKPFSAIGLAAAAKDVLEGKKVTEKEKIPAYKDPLIMPMAKLLIIDTDHYRHDCLRGYFTLKEHCGGQYEISSMHIILSNLYKPEKYEGLYSDIEKELMLSKPDIVLGCSDIYSASSDSAQIYPRIKDSKYKPLDMIIYGEDIEVRGAYGTGLPGMENLIKRLKQLASGENKSVDPGLDKLGKIVRESAVKNNLYIKTEGPVRIPGL